MVHKIFCQLHFQFNLDINLQYLSYWVHNCNVIKIIGFLKAPHKSFFGVKITAIISVTESGFRESRKSRNPGPESRLSGLGIKGLGTSGFRDLMIGPESRISGMCFSPDSVTLLQLQNRRLDKLKKLALLQ